MNPPTSTRGLRFWQAVITLEARSPLTVGAGAGDDLRDSICVTDANGLPTLPGTSIAGALRARWPDSGRDALFGPERGNGDARRSRAWVGWAAPHDARNEPVPYLVPDALKDDAVLALLRGGTTRDHVRISPFGTADREGKFDETLVPRGARFSFELRIEDPEPGDVVRMLGLFRDGSLRLGGGTRRGFGLVQAVALRASSFDLAKAKDRDEWAKYAAELSLGKRGRLLAAEREAAAPAQPTGAWRAARLDLRAEAGWRVGGRDREGWEVDGREADLVPVVEPAIAWRDEGGGTRGRRVVQAFLPGSSVKGALRHRSAFHLRCLREEWRPADWDIGAEHGKAYTDGLEHLFGRAKDKKGRSEEASDRRAAEDIAGRVYVSDVVVATAEESETATLRTGAAYQQHVSLDRFTSAPLAGHLFSEAMLYKTTLTLDVLVDLAGPTEASAPTDLRDELRALRRALRDLCKGRLALGAAAARGHGTFTGSATGALLQEE
jgi:CRISPR/Cas system CSM-associated protein Csm3 (group 7 of RAMP superfamily)